MATWRMHWSDAMTLVYLHIVPCLCVHVVTTSLTELYWALYNLLYSVLHLANLNLCAPMYEFLTCWLVTTLLTYAHCVSNNNLAGYAAGNAALAIALSEVIDYCGSRRTWFASDHERRHAAVHADCFWPLWLHLEYSTGGQQAPITKAFQYQNEKCSAECHLCFWPDREQAPAAGGYSQLSLLTTFMPAPYMY